MSERISFAAAFVGISVWLVGSSAAAAPPFRRGPILQALGSKAVTVKLELAVPGTVEVEVTGPANAKITASDPASERFHAVRVTGLAPDTRYEYEVRSGSLSERGRFTTAPEENKPFRFLVYGDSRSDPEAHAAVVRAIASAPGDFFVHTGDMVYDGSDPADWQSFFDIEHELLRDRCIFASVGNHELLGPPGAGRSAFLQYFASLNDDGKEEPKLHGSFRWSNTRFFLLNAMDQWTGEEKTWLKEALDRASSEPGLAHRVAVLHHGPFSSGPHGPNERLHNNHILDVLNEGKVDLVIAGHDHLYERGASGKLKYIVSGGAGAPIYPKKRDLAESQKVEPTHHFVEVSVDKDRVDIVARRASGSEIERCGFTGEGPWECAGSSAPASSGPPKSAAAPSSPAPLPASSACLCAWPGAPSSSRSIPGWAAIVGLVALWRVRRRV